MFRHVDEVLHPVGDVCAVQHPQRHDALKRYAGILPRGQSETLRAVEEGIGIQQSGEEFLPASCGQRSRHGEQHDQIGSREIAQADLEVVDGQQAGGIILPDGDFRQAQRGSQRGEEGSKMFMHGGFTHLFFNMFAVWMFGRILEQVWGPKRFLSYYMICGIGAGLISMLVTYIRIQAAKTGMSPEMINTVYQEGAQIIRDNMNYTYPPMANLNALLNGVTVGASGAVYAILLGFGMLFPNQPLFIFPLPFPIKAKYFVIGYALIELYAGFANNPNDNVAHFAHLGGMIFGFILIMYWRKKDRGNGYYYN